MIQTPPEAQSKKRGASPVCDGDDLQDSSNREAVMTTPPHRAQSPPGRPCRKKAAKAVQPTSEATLEPISKNPPEEFATSQGPKLFSTRS